MERRVADIEFEQMLLSRYTLSRHRDREGLDRSAYVLLSGVDEHGPMSINELSTVFRLESSTVQRQTASALRAGLLERVLDPDGGVARKFALTAEGRQRLQYVRDRSVSSLDRILEGWSSEDVNTFADLLHRFNASIEGRTVEPQD